MDVYQKILQSMSALLYKINSNDKHPKPFGTKELLYQSEIHFIDAIGIDKEINASQLSEKLKISNGAITQVATKLIKKNLVKKYKKEENKKTVYFMLTQQGKVAYNNHVLFHKRQKEKITAYLRKLNQEQIEGILGFLEEAEKSIPDLSKNE